MSRLSSFVLVFLGACGAATPGAVNGDGTDGGAGDDDGSGGGGDPTACVRDSDCAADQACDDGQCIEVAAPTVPSGRFERARRTRR